MILGAGMLNSISSKPMRVIVSPLFLKVFDR